MLVDQNASFAVDSQKKIVQNYVLAGTESNLTILKLIHVDFRIQDEKK